MRSESHFVVKHASSTLLALPRVRCHLARALSLSLSLSLEVAIRVFDSGSGRWVFEVTRRPLFTGEMDPLNHYQGSNTLHLTKDGVPSSHSRDYQMNMGCEEKKVAVHEEMKRMNQLPANSTYATHRLRVLNKILELMSIQRTRSQDEELELLFASLSI